MRDTERVLSMDFMRVISIMMILAFHLYVEAIKNPAFNDLSILKPLGVIGVSFFIIISGSALSTSSKHDF